MVFGEVLTAMVTPFDEEGSLALDSLPELINHLTENGSDGLVVLGTTGESPTLTKNEKIKVLEEICRLRREQGLSFSLVAGTGSYSTSESIEMTARASELDIDGIMLVTPYYNKPPQQGLKDHFTAIAESTSLPVILYNVPGRTGTNLDAETTVALSQVDNIVGIKEASGDQEQIAHICRETAPDFLVYSGDDSMTLPLISLGGHGVISVAGHLVGERIKEMIVSYKRGKVKKAAEINQNLLPLFKALFLTTNPIPVKAAVNLLGIKAGPTRLPLSPLPEEEKNELQRMLKEDYGLL